MFVSTATGQQQRVTPRNRQHRQLGEEPVLPQRCGTHNLSPVAQQTSCTLSTGLIQRVGKTRARDRWDFGASQLQMTRELRIKRFLGRAGSEANLRQDLPLERNLIPSVA